MCVCVQSITSIFKVNLCIVIGAGTHCLDIVPAMERDPNWLKDQHKYEVEIIKGWITEYYRADHLPAALRNHVDFPAALRNDH